ncbi:epidermal growth factor-like protein [Condylostylus longicornis]|uniref:epidermal growth factor-like protein n=1 Tax=Condylostylus longicornis TaxID=2530218 RepID=UPI00244DE608|nr:epidermal growth factor-like protein [Condylostylus longicornis]
MLLSRVLLIIIIFECVHFNWGRIVNNNYNNNNLDNNNNQEDLEHKCLREVPTIYLEYDKKYTNITEGSKKYYSKIEVCCDGYKRSKYDWDKCVPDCGECEHGLCLNPDTCECFPNYVKNHEGKCVMKCPVHCENGHCKLDGTCKCNRGYKLDESQTFCKPICNRNNNCEAAYNQYCSAPNTCSCIKGYQVNRHGCEPICERSCGINGTCDRPNTCRCHNGAILKNGICQAECYQKCENGICVTPNRCICFEGFRYDVRTSSCIPKAENLKNFAIEQIDLI